MKMKYLILLVVGVLFLGIAAACAGGAAPAATPIKAAATAAPAAGAGDPAKGKALAASKGCGACHTIQGVSGATGTLATDLTHIASAKTIAGQADLPVSAENLKKWLKDPAKAKAGAKMPNPLLKDQEIEDLVAFLLTLK